MKIDIRGSLKSSLLNTVTNRNAVVLDVGCGDGRIAGYLAQHSKKVFALDPDKACVKSAKEANEQKNLYFQVGRGEALCFGPASFDSVLFCQSLHHVATQYQSAALQGAGSVLLEGGRLTIVEPVYRKGALGEIFALYGRGKEAKHHAMKAAGSLGGRGFSCILDKEIQVDCACQGFEDLINNHINKSRDKNWDESVEASVKSILNKCDAGPNGEIIMAYYVRVLSFEKAKHP